jgi:hypothetical protein
MALNHEMIVHISMHEGNVTIIKEQIFDTQGNHFSSQME